MHLRLLGVFRSGKNFFDSVFIGKFRRKIGQPPRRGDPPAPAPRKRETFRNPI